MSREPVYEEDENGEDHVVGYYDPDTGAYEELEPTDRVTTVKCPHCGAVRAFRAFSAVFAFTCRECGAGVDVQPPKA